MRRLNKRFLLLTAVFGVAITAASFNFKGEDNIAFALSNTSISGTQGKWGITSTSFDGRYVAFLSDDQNLISGETDPNYATDAFLKDTETNTVTRLSISNVGGFANNRTQWVILSGNGRYALMESLASNLASTSPSGSGQASVYLRDLKTNITTLVKAGVPGAGYNYYAEALSEDGRFIYFSSQGDSDSGGLFVKDMRLNTTERVDVNNSSTAGNGWINFRQSSTSCDGRFVAFSSDSSNLTSGDTNGKADIFVVDRMNGHSINNITANGNDASLAAKISCDGNHVVFGTLASNILSTDTNSTLDLVDYDISRETFAPVSLDSSGNQFGDYMSSTGTVGYGHTNVSVSIDGRFIAFQADKFYSFSPSTGTTMTNKILVRDMQSGTTTLVTPDYGSSSQANSPAITADGKTVYYSDAYNHYMYKATSY